MNKSELNKLVNKSGYPFQLAVKNEIIKGKETGKHDWSIGGNEIPWSNKDSGNSGFIDLIITHNIKKIAIECKRALNEYWVFLKPNGFNKKKFYSLKIFKDDSSRPKEQARWDNFSLNSLEMDSTEFCVIHNNSRPLIETEIAKLVDSIEALAQKEMLQLRSGQSDREIWYIPIIITNAKLIISEFDESNINLSDGQINESNNNFREVNFVKFDKSIKTESVTNSNIYSEKGLVTCFIINIEHLNLFLQYFNMEPFTVWSM